MAGIERAASDLVSGSEAMPERGEKRVDTFAEYHPLINFIYFVMVIGIAMFYMHPVLLGLSLAGSLAYSIYLKGRKTVKVFLFGMLPACLLMMVINPLFSHEGATMLFYLKDGNPVTLESILYGVGSGIMLACVVSWFSVFHAVMTSDKFMYLFGKVIPAFSLLLSMCLRFVPRFTGQIKKVAPGAAVHRQECQQRKSMGTGGPWPENPFRYYYMGAGKFRGDSRFYEVQGLWAAGPDKFLHLSL